METVPLNESPFRQSGLTIVEIVRTTCVLVSSVESAEESNLLFTRANLLKNAPIAACCARTPGVTVFALLGFLLNAVTER